MYVSITDTNWINFITNNINNIGTYINFWTPGSKIFKAISPGELFLFKLHSRKSKGENGEIIGGAFFDSFEQMSIKEAWNRFGYGNGVESLSELESAINDYRTHNNINKSINIGCIILRDVFFFDKNKWIESPSDWQKSIVSGKKYNTSNEIGYSLYQKVMTLIQCDHDEEIISKIETNVKNLKLEGMEKEIYIKTRINQGIFRDRLLNKYHSCCLCNVSNPKLLIASHIKPWVKSEAKEKLDSDNGLLLCPNHDALFDSGYISFDENGRIMISEKLNEIDAIFMNVNKNMKIILSSKNKEYLEYHRNNIFKK